MSEKNWLGKFRINSVYVSQGSEIDPLLGELGRANWELVFFTFGLFVGHTEKEMA